MKYLLSASLLALIACAVSNTAHAEGRDNIVTLVVENDKFGGGTDKNYTSGLRLGYIDINSKIPGFARETARIVPMFEVNETTSVFYSLGQNIYTPESKEREQDPDDRPWAGFLYGSVGMVTFTDNRSDEIEMTLGVVGPAALGEQAQKAIHRHISNSPTPQGWSNQLDNEPALMLAWQRSYPRYFAGTLGPLFWSAAPHYGATVGNVMTFAETGLNARIGPASEKWQDTPLRVRPAMPGTGFFEIPEKKWSWYLFGGLEGRAVARNIFLDGNTFSDSHSVDKKILVADANAGLALTYDRMRISYTLVYRTKEFETQSEPDVFAAISMGYRF
jgi:lipid A 3-O-deacylase